MDSFNNKNNNDEIKISQLISTLKRQKNLIIFLTVIPTIISMIQSLIVKPIWKGSFDIVVKTERNENNYSSKRNPLNSFLMSSLNTNKTQEIILKSPSVLMPVFDYLKKEYSLKGKSIEEMDFYTWSNTSLNVKFTEGSNVLRVSFKNTDKDLIIKTLNLISSKYKDYSKKDREKTLVDTFNYLTNQKKIMTEKTKLSFIELNKFSIENGLGDIDGFVNLGKPSDVFGNLNISNLFSSGDDVMSNLINRNRVDTKIESGQRFKRQFNKLETYETQYTDLSSKLKPNSKVLKNLKIKIDNLRASLKRPNEILLKYRELYAKAQRDENILTGIDENLEIIKLEKIKIPNPWEMISTPRIDRTRVSPRRKQQAIISFLISFIIAYFIGLTKEKLSKKIYFTDVLLNLIPYRYLDTLLIHNPEISKLIIENAIKKYKKSNKQTKINIFKFKINEGNSLLEEIIDLKKVNFLDLEPKKVSEINKDQEAIFIIENGSITSQDVLTLNKYISLFDPNKVCWINIASEI